MGTVPQCRVVTGERGQLINLLVKHMVWIEVVLGMGAIGAEQIVVKVVRHATREHRLAGRLIPTRVASCETLLVAVVDHRVAPGEVHQLMRKPVPGQ